MAIRSLKGFLFSLITALKQCDCFIWHLEKETSVNNITLLVFDLQVRWKTTRRYCFVLNLFGAFTDKLKHVWVKCFQIGFLPNLIALNCSIVSCCTFQLCKAFKWINPLVGASQRKIRFSKKRTPSGSSNLNNANRNF